MACIGNDLALQPHMPQIVLCNEHALTKTQPVAAPTFMPDNVWVCRATTSWVGAATFAAALGWLARALAHLRVTSRHRAFRLWSGALAPSGPLRCHKAQRVLVLHAHGQETAAAAL